MFEFYLKYGNENQIVDHYNVDNPFYEGKKFIKTAFKYESLQIITLSHQAKESFTYENEEALIIVQGKVFFRQDFLGLSTESIPPEKLYNLMKSDKDYYRKIKGNFSIILYNKQSTLLKVITDQFALLPLYYGKINDEIYISNNLNHFKYFSLPIDSVVLLEQLVFGYPIAKESIYKGVKQVPEGTLLEMKGDAFSIKSLARLSELIFKEDLHRFDLQEFLNLFNTAVSQKASVAENKILHVRDDIHSRLVHSSFLRKNINARFMSFGKAGASNTAIPQAVAKQTNQEHQTIYLDENFEKQIPKLTFESIFFSDGQSGAEEVDHLYSTSNISNESSILFSSDMAKELLLPLTKINDLMHDDYIKIIYEKGEYNLNQIFEDRGISKFVSQELIDNNMILFFDKMQEKKKEVQGKKLGEEGFLYYLYDLFKIVFKRNYGTRFHSNRFYASTLPVFFDIDVMQYLIRSHHNEVYRNGLDEDAWKMVKPLQLYAQIFQLNEPSLNKVSVDKGYIPLNLLNVFKRPLIKNQLVKNSKLSSYNPPKEQEWAVHFYTYLQEFDLSDSKYFKVDAIIEYIENYKPANYSKEVNNVINTYTWLSVL